MILKNACFAFLGLLAMGFATSCKKKTTPPSPPPTPAMTATISGATWKASTIKASSISGLDTVSGFQASDSSTVLLLFPPNAVVVGDTLYINSINTIQYKTSANMYSGVGGYITISSYANNYVTGTFQATVEDFNTSNKISIAGGTFTAKL